MLAAALLLSYVECERQLSFPCQAPEVMDGERPTAAGDVYSFGMVRSAPGCRLQGASCTAGWQSLPIPAASTT